MYNMQQGHNEPENFWSDVVGWALNTYLDNGCYQATHICDIFLLYIIIQTSQMIKSLIKLESSASCLINQRPKSMTQHRWLRTLFLGAILKAHDLTVLFLALFLVTQVASLASLLHLEAACFSLVTTHHNNTSDHWSETKIGVRNPMKMLDIVCLKNEPTSNSKTENSLSAVRFSKTDFGDYGTHSQFTFQHDRINSSVFLYAVPALLVLSHFSWQLVGPIQHEVRHL